MNRKSTLVFACVFACGIMLASLFIYTPTAKGNVLYVGGTGPGNFTLIKNAINSANDGDTVIICAGTYTERFTIDKAIRLIGEGKELTKIKGFEGSSVASVVANNTFISGITFEYAGEYVAGVIIENANECTIENCSFVNTFYGIKVTGNNCSISDCTFTNSSYAAYFYAANSSSFCSNKVKNCTNYGFFASNCSSLSIDSNDLENCDTGGIFVTNSEDIECKQNSINGGERGLHLYSSPNSSAIGNRIIGCRWNMKIENSQASIISQNECNNGEFGLYIVSSNFSKVENVSASSNSMGNLYMENSACKVSNSKFSNSQSYGICSVRSNVEIINCTSFNNTYGIKFDKTNNSILNMNRCSNNDYGAWFFSSNNCIISNNTFASNEQHGAYFANSSYSKIYRNNFISNGLYGLVFSSSSNNLIYENNFALNTKNVCSYSTSTNTWYFDNHGNYWDDYEGLDDGSNARIAGDGIGDTLIPHPYTDQGNGYFSLDNYPIMNPLDIPGFFIQNRPPKLTFGNVTPSLGNATTIFNFEVNFSDPDGDEPANSTLIIDSMPRTMTKSTGNKYVYSSTFENGTHYFYFIFDDGNGGYARYPISGNLSFSVDTKPPSISLVYPANGSCISQGSNLEFNIYDENLASAFYTINDTTLPLLYPYTVTLPQDISGDCTVEITAYDKVYNSASAIFVFNISSKVSIELISPFQLTITPGTEIVLSIKNATYANYTLGSQNSQSYELLPPYVIHTTASNDGTYDITI
ncbi:MAG: NosD domain-containing protein [Thermoplasmata archaeon]